MGRTRRISLLLLAVVAGVWAVSLTSGGIWVFFWDGIADEGPARLGRRALGLLAAAGGQLVFLCCVADRIYPGASQRLRWTLELVTCGGMGSALVGMLFAGLWWVAA